MANQEPFTFRGRNTGEKVPHAGSPSVPPEVREVPFSEADPVTPALLSNPIEIPDTMLYTDKEKALAREKQRETMPWYKKKGVRLAGAALALGGISIPVGMNILHNDKVTSASDLNPTEKDPDILNVDGNLYPEKANPDYDKIFGITTELGNDGSLIGHQQDLLERWSVTPVSVDEDQAVALSTIDKNATGDSVELRNTMFNDLTPRVEAWLNALNMNNPTVQMTHSSYPGLSADQVALLQNANLVDEINKVFTNPIKDYMYTPMPDAAVAPVEASVPNDAGLRAVVCKFAGEQPQVCTDVSEADAGFYFASTTHELTREDTGEPLSLRDGTLGRKFDIGVVWVNGLGEPVSHDRISFNAFTAVRGDELTMEDIPDMPGFFTN